MKKILVTLIVVLLCVGFTYFFFVRMSTEDPLQTNNPPTGVEFPNAGTGGNNPVVDPFPDEPYVSVDEDTLSFQLANGSRVEVNDFINNGITVSDVVNPGNHILAGPLGYCLPDGSCPHGAEVTGFSVSYGEKFNNFNIILEEPLRANRIKAEEFMIKTLGIERRNLCDLPYRIGTTSYINSQLAGYDFRFSFCPGAVALP